MSERHEPVVEPGELAAEPEPQERSRSKRREPVSGESTAPFLLERSSSDLQKAAEQARKDALTQSSDGIPKIPGAVVDTGADVLKSARRLGVIVVVNASLYLAVAAAGALRYSRDRTAIPEVVLAIIAAGLAIWGLLSGYHLLQASRSRADAGHQLSGAFSNFRSIFILKGTGLFLVLALSCFAFSAVLSLAALL